MFPIKTTLFLLLGRGPSDCVLLKELSVSGSCLLVDVPVPVSADHLLDHLAIAPDEPGVGGGS